MNTEPHTNGLVTFLGLNFDFGPHQMSTAFPSCNLALSTSFFGTGLALAALYVNFFKGGRHGRNTNNTFTPVDTFTPAVQWIEHPANYNSPVMDLFSEDQAPFGVSPSLSCPWDSEHLERAFDTLRYQHLFRELGVPYALDQRSPSRLLRILGNTSSGSSLDFWFSSKSRLLSSLDSTYGGPQNDNGSMGGEKYTYVGSSALYPALTSTRLPPLSQPGGEQFQGVPVWTASLVVAIAVLGILAKRGWRYPSSSEQSTTPESFREILEDGNSNGNSNGEAHDNDDKGCAPTTDIRALRPRLSPVSDKPKGEPDSYWAGITTSSLIVAIHVFCLLAKRGRSHGSSPEPPTSTTFDNIWELLDDGHGNDKNLYRNCAPPPPSKLVLGVLINPERFVEQLFDDPLAHSYVPHMVLQFPDDDWSSVEDSSAPVEYAAQFDALRDAMFSFLGLWKTTERSPLDLFRVFVFGVAIFLCIGLRVMVFLVTRRFGCRGIQQLVKEFKNVKPSDAVLAVDIPNAMLPASSLGFPKQQIKLSSNVSDIGNSAGSGTQIIDHMQVDEEAYEGMIAAWVLPLLGSIFSAVAYTVLQASSTLVDAVETVLSPTVQEEMFTSQPSCSAYSTLAVETDLAPAVNEEKAKVEGDGGGWTVVNRRKRGRKGKNIPTDVARDEDAVHAANA